MFEIMVVFVVYVIVDGGVVGIGEYYVVIGFVYGLV